MLNKIKNELKGYKYYKNDDNYKNNIDFLIKIVDDLIYDVDITDDTIKINFVLNSDWFHLYVFNNTFNSEFFAGMIFKKMTLYKDNYTIIINDCLFDLKNYLLSSYYERY